MKQFFFCISALLLVGMYVTGQNRVGIGTTAPFMKLHVAGTDSALLLLDNQQALAPGVKSSLYFKTGTSYTSAIKTIGTSINDARIGFFSTATIAPNTLAERLTIADAGNVGIGDTMPTLAGLVVNTRVGAVNAMFGKNTKGVSIQDNFPGIGFNQYYNAGSKAMNTGYGSLVGQDPNSGRFYIATSTAAAASQSATMALAERISIKPDGNVGVQGNTDPQSPLSFANTLGEKINFWNVDAANNYGIGIQGAQMQLYTGGSGDAISFGYGSSAGFTEKARLQYGYMVLNNGRIKFNGQYSAGNSAGIEFTNTTGTTTRGFMGQFDDNNMGFYGYGGGGWGFLYDVNDGSLKIGTTQKATGYLVNVGGKIIAEEVRVQLRSAWPDYVFGKKYNLLSLNEVENYIQANNHLPNVPAASEVEKSGIALGEMQTKMMEKIEELTLYIISLKKEIVQQHLEIEKLKKRK